MLTVVSKGLEFGLTSFRYGIIIQHANNTCMVQVYYGGIHSYLVALPSGTQRGPKRQAPLDVHMLLYILVGQSL